MELGWKKGWRRARGCYRQRIDALSCLGRGVARIVRGDSKGLKVLL